MKNKTTRTPTTLVRIDKDTLEIIRAAAKARKLSMRALVELVLREYLAEHAA